MSDDNILQIRPVDRKNLKLVIGLAAEGGNGKTRSALELAHGLTDYQPEKIGLLDTENRRGSIYADVFKPKRFLIGDLMPPFSPERYIKAMREFADSGIEVLIIDSTTHEYEGEGGITEIADLALLKGKKVADWNGAKREHKRYMSTLLYLPMHIICCIRAREKTKFVQGKPPESEGIKPVAEKNFLFEMTIAFMLENHGKERIDLKPNDQFGPIFDEPGYLNAGQGKKLRDWVGGFDPDVIAMSTLRLAATRGMEELKIAFLALPKNQQKSLGAFKDTLKDTASAADEETRLGSLQHQSEESQAPLV